MKNNKGFSLVELIVVIAIMAILAAVAVIGVSVYIPKAQEANDKELLNIMSDALTSACLSEGIDQRDISASVTVLAEGKLADATGHIELTITGGGLTDAQKDKIEEIFNSVLSDDKAAFKRVEAGAKIYYRNGIFALGNPAYDGIVFDQADIDNVKDSSFGDLGAETLLGRIDLATNILNQLSTGENAALRDKVNQMMTNDENMYALAKYLGYDLKNHPELEEEFYTEKFLPLQQTKAAMLKEIYGNSKTDDELMSLAYTEIMANNAVLVAATNSNKVQDDFADAMANGTAKDVILDNLAGDPEDVSTALSQAAMVYGMYTAYAAKEGIEVSDELDVQTVLDAMDDSDFQSYMASEAQKDLDAYGSAMNMINTSTQNEDAVVDVLLNGFNNDSLSGMMGEAFN